LGKAIGDVKLAADGTVEQQLAMHRTQLARPRINDTGRSSPGLEIFRLPVSYWVILTPVFGVISIVKGWSHFLTRNERLALVYRLAAIWCIGHQLKGSLMQCLSSLIGNPKLQADGIAEEPKVRLGHQESPYVRNDARFSDERELHFFDA
jgi:hypothetical protein